MMGVPIIFRELRVEAQRPFNYWLRVLSAGLVIALIAAFVIDRSSRTPLSGSLIFSFLHGGLFFGIWIFVPLLTADCLSLEKREGTLGLLFLTRLTPRSIVGAKAVIHVLRALTVFLAMAPAILLPFLLGGISWQQSLVALGLNLGAMFIALTAGLCASAWCQAHSRAISLAILLSMVFSSLFAYVFAWGFFRQVSSSYYYSTIPAGVTAIGFLLITGTGALWNEVFVKLTALEREAWMMLAGEMLLFSMAIFGIAIVVCGNQLRLSLQNVPGSLGRMRLVELICAPRFWVASLQRRMSSSLDRNPIGWLQEYSWSARAIKWGWLGLFGMVDAWMIGQQTEGTISWRDMVQAHFYLSIALGMGMMASAVASFRRERQNGVLELLLISPISAEQIIKGRVYGIWTQFYPAALLLLVVWWQVLNVGPMYRFMPDLKWFFVSTFLTLPVFGLWCSLVHRSFIVTWLFGSLLGIGLPYYLGITFARQVRLYYATSMTFAVVSIAVQLGLAYVAWKLLRQNLRERTFALN
jgi:ABC-type transport system involved in cytochrome c biogenesis permease component